MEEDIYGNCWFKTKKKINKLSYSTITGNDTTNEINKNETKIKFLAKNQIFYKRVTRNQQRKMERKHNQAREILTFIPPSIPGEIPPHSPLPPLDDDRSRLDLTIERPPELPPTPALKIRPLGVNGTSWGVGGRKTSRAVAFLTPASQGLGKITINKKPMVDYFAHRICREIVLEPYLITERLGSFNTVINVTGGGIVSQAGAVRHAIARALEMRDPQLRLPLKHGTYNLFFIIYIAIHMMKPIPVLLIRMNELRINSHDSLLT